MLPPLGLTEEGPSWPQMMDGGGGDALQDDWDEEACPEGFTLGGAVPPAAAAAAEAAGASAAALGMSHTLLHVALDEERPCIR